MEERETAVVSSPAGGRELLAFYETHQILPVRYRGSIDEHLDRRDALYRSLGLPFVAINGARVLEVASGTGQNSLHVASCGPASLDLVEPTATGRRDIEANYRAFDRPHTTPQLHACTLQEFESANPFDIVICENWLGSLPSDLDLIRKLITFMAPGGLLVMTMILPSGLFANVMRKLFALRLLDLESSIEEKTRRMTDVISKLSRSCAQKGGRRCDRLHLTACRRASCPSRFEVRRSNIEF